MQQYNPTGEKGRNCWKTSRERARIKARFDVRQRVERGDDAEFRSATIVSIEETQAVLQRILDGDRSFFSVIYIQERLDWFSTTIAATYLWANENELFGEQKILSWYGIRGLEEFKQFLRQLRTFSFMEFAVWMKRYFIVGSLLVGGVLPTIRGSFQHQTIDDDEGHDELHQTGKYVLQCFFRPIPLTLASYMVKRVVDMRREIHGLSVSLYCALCQRNMPCTIVLCYGKPCYHKFCEPCYWKYLLQGLEDRDDDVVMCPCCPPASKKQSYSDTIDTGTGPTNPHDLFELSKKRYQSLPATAKELKRRQDKKGKISERNSLCSTWATAVASSLGNSQDVRRDKFFLYVEKGSFFQVKACLQAGVDLGYCNEYGQTILHIAVWRNLTKIVYLLLEYGCDPNSPSHGGVRPRDIALKCSSSDILMLLESYGALPCPHYCIVQRPLEYRDGVIALSTVIPDNLDHPGAGSYVLDHTLSDGTIKELIELWKRIPIEKFCKEKNLPCNDRSYFCDTLQSISSFISNALVSTGRWTKDQIAVLPHMRFLSYSHSGSLLGPHVDLRRVHPFSGERSTHTFILYLTSCEVGGETVLLRELKSTGDDNIILAVSPRRGRLLLFPHGCPHEGAEVKDVPKILVRGEIITR